MDASGGHGTRLTTVRLQTLLADRPRKSVSRVAAVDDRPFPSGPASAETLDVITSYSIHYTKLYDRVFSRFR